MQRRISTAYGAAARSFWNAKAMWMTSRSLVFLLCGFGAGLVFLPLAALLLSSLGWLSVDGVSVPPGWESRIGQAALEASLAHRSAGLIDPVSGTDANLRAGMKIYRDDCAGCHGDSDRVSAWGMTSFYPRVPQFVRQPPKLTAPEMFVAAKYGIRYTGMGAWDGQIADLQIWQAVTFLSRLNSLPPAVRKSWNARH